MNALPFADVDADSMLAAGGDYTGPSLEQTKAFTMIIPDGFDVHRGFRPLWRTRAWVLERLIVLDLASGDLRWAVIDLGLRSLSALSVAARKWVASFFRNATSGAAADTTVAAAVG